MKKQHHKSLKFHTLFTILLGVATVILIILKPDLLLVISSLALVAYVAGNGIIHARKNQLSRDSILEYSIVGLIILIIIVSALLQ